jgi:hypothetical protein
MQPGHHSLWGITQSCRVAALRELGRLEEARSEATQSIEQALAVGNLTFTRYLQLELVLIDAKAGDTEAACRLLDTIIDTHTQDASAVTLALAYEVRARVAIQMEDRPTFERYLGLCKARYALSGGNPALAAKYDRLVQEARHAGLLGITDRSTDTLQAASATGSSQASRVQLALGECAARNERYRRALELLVADSGAEQGHLYLIGESGLELVAASDRRPPDKEVESVLARLIGEYEADDESATEWMTTVGGTAGGDKPLMPSISPFTRDGAYPLLLRSEGNVQGVTVGAAVLFFAPDAEVRLPIDTASAIARYLLEAGDAEAVATSHTMGHGRRSAG